MMYTIKQLRKTIPIKKFNAGINSSSPANILTTSGEYKTYRLVDHAKTTSSDISQRDGDTIMIRSFAIRFMFYLANTNTPIRPPTLRLILLIDKRPQNHTGSVALQYYDSTYKNGLMLQGDVNSCYIILFCLPCK